MSTWIRTISPSEATGRLKREYDTATKRAGRVYGIVRAMSPNPGILASSMQLYGTIMFGPSELSRRQREMLAVVVSKANDCHY